MAVTTEELLHRIEALEARLNATGPSVDWADPLTLDWPIWPEHGTGDYTLWDIAGSFPELAAVTDAELEASRLQSRDLN
jgi:hypothetical protein